jgi:hypothetical protein
LRNEQKMSKQDAQEQDELDELDERDEPDALEFEKIFANTAPRHIGVATTPKSRENFFGSGCRRVVALRVTAVSPAGERCKHVVGAFAAAATTTITCPGAYLALTPVGLSSVC